MKLTNFTSFILVLLVLWMSFYARVRETFNGVSEYRSEISRLRHQANEDRVARDLDHEHFLEFRQSVATLMPDAVKNQGEGERGYAYRNLASVVSKPQSTEVRRLVAKTLFETGREQFRKKDYVKAIRNFKQIIDRFSYTPFVTDAYFLMAESYFQQNQLEECTAVIQQMIELFPQHELTGFALVRLGRIYEAQNRTEEAIDIYKTVLRSYPQRDVASQARSSLKGVEL